jgi:hypothetical protein
LAQAAQTKYGQYKAKCDAVNIEFLAGAVDMFGDMHKDLHSFISTIAAAMTGHGVCDKRAATTICFGRFNIQVARCAGDLFVLHSPGVR